MPSFNSAIQTIVRDYKNPLEAVGTFRAFELGQLEGDWLAADDDFMAQYAEKQKLTDYAYAMHVLYFSVRDALKIWPRLNLEHQRFLCRTVVGIPLIAADDPAEAVVVENGTQSIASDQETELPLFVQVNCEKIASDIFPLPRHGVLTMYCKDTIGPMQSGKNFAVEFSTKGEAREVLGNGSSAYYYKAAPVEITDEMVAQVTAKFDSLLESAEKFKIANDYNNFGELIRGVIDDHFENQDGYDWKTKIPSSTQLFGVFSGQQSEPRKEGYREDGDYDWMPEIVKELGKTLVERGAVKDYMSWQLHGASDFAHFFMNKVYAGQSIPLFSTNTAAYGDDSVSFMVPRFHYTQGNFAHTECVTQST